MHMTAISTISNHSGDRRVFTYSEAAEAVPIALAVLADEGCTSHAAPYFFQLWENELADLAVGHDTPFQIKRLLQKALTSYLSGTGLEAHRHNFVRDGGALALFFSLKNRYYLYATGECSVYLARGTSLPQKCLCSPPNKPDKAGDDAYTLYSRCGRLHSGDTFLLHRGASEVISQKALRAVMYCPDDKFDRCTDEFCRLLSPTVKTDAATALAVRFTGRKKSLTV